MSPNNIVIREITQADDAQLAAVVRSVFIELDAPKVGTAYEDASLDMMTETYNNPKMAYFVVAYGDKILGGCGIAHLEGADETVCELQKMYFLPEARGKGIGAEMIEKCLNKAKEFGFKSCYLETLPFMIGAQKLYTKVGFQSLQAPMGTTGHYSCNVWMLKHL
ncbi:GNAT family N-acetyltransferase [Bizionia myxarmorum]|uniref:GNAT family N-acetyltransferase n=1 Tax=Bizionia myxarmorum TaxID=291186 RepID=A0A5D0RGJ6_9FLAO|nr:GNAT family N-acetyltransferase [Bizionia myxarmorum]TYB79654.1 GNAT family N-acetyltransferase [Bizionia myxarmorum]